ncbi:hypothetical protein HN460_01450 [bacterium]|jgi:hypothetical protein|nr:hypothetical protein [bacterium]MBT3795836.1 hypothetical protein [bacterium]MBT4634367.1 hypothetical protein [bacterium]
MVLFTKVTGLILIFLGGLGYYLYETRTVLIPIILGSLILILGLVADNLNRKRMAIHIAVMLTVVGLVVCWSGIKELPLLLSCGGILTCDAVNRPVAVLFRSTMFIVLFPYFIASIIFFIKARMSK